MSGEGRVAPKGLYWHKSLRNPNINYQSGWWSVSIQVAKNKSILGAIVGEKVVLNTLGRAVDDYWRTLPKKYPELEILDYVVMPNHFHALLRIHYMPSNREHHLGFLMSRFKGGTSFIYGKMRRTGGVEDIGEKLWQRDYWDDLVSSEEEFKGWQKYIRENPANWSSDRYGACTAYALGDTELLNRPRIAFVASQGFVASELRPLVAVFPAGIPEESALEPRLAAAICEGWALAISPQAPGSRLNKKIATWCNEFLLKNADEIWVGHLSPNGMLTQMLAGLGRGSGT